MSRYLFLAIYALTFLSTLPLAAQNDSPSATPTISFYDRDAQETVTMAVGESRSTNAPCEITCEANLDYDASVYDRVFSEWKIFKTDEGEDKAIVDRFDENITFTLTESGGYTVKYIPTFVNSEENDTIELDAEYTFSIVISESKLICTDFLSPNDDYMNDKLEIDFQHSLKKFYFYNLVLHLFQN